MRPRVPRCVPALLPCLLACASIELVDPTVPLELGADEGLLIVHVDTDYWLFALESSGGTLVEGVEPGHHVWVLRAGAGPYRFTRVRVPGGELAQDRQLFGGEFHFQVRAGRLNYPGALVLRSTAPGPDASYADVRARNRAGMALRVLREEHPRLLESVPLHYAGPGQDDFLDYFEAQREGRRVEAAAESPR